MLRKTPKTEVSKSHNPTPEERDERFSLYGLDPEKVGEVMLTTRKNSETLAIPRRTRKAEPKPNRADRE